MLNEFAAEDSASGLRWRLSRLCRPQILVCDEIGYPSYGNRHADLLFEVVTRRYNPGKPILATTNQPFAEWSEVFPNAACVVTLVDQPDPPFRDRPDQGRQLPPEGSQGTGR